MPQTDWGAIDIARSSGSSWATAPALDQLELTLFGPGFGECAVIHVGGNHWVVIDSCWSAASQRPVALEYLTLLGLDPVQCVDLIVATHWHDDHIRGLAALVQACPKAIFSCSAAFATEEFESMILAFDRQRMVRAGSGAREVNAVFGLLQDRPVPPRRASASKALLRIEPDRAGHDRDVRCVALSPSDHEYTLALAAIGKLMPKASETQYRCPPQEPNLLSVAIHIEIGETSMLLGADLELHSDERRGWAAVLRDATLPKSWSILFKIPHHGSQSSFSAGVWTELLVREPLAVTTPWVRGDKRLPSASDIRRIVEHTPHAFISSLPSTGQSGVARPAMVARQLREMGAKVYRIEPQIGAVRLRNGGISAWKSWAVTLHDAARQLIGANAGA